MVKNEINELIQESAKHSDISLVWYLPQTVRLEREYQMWKEAKGHLGAVKKLEPILARDLQIDEDTVFQAVRETTEKQIGELGLQILHLDSAKVNWKGIIENAAYRRAPFSEGDAEKGFRDATIAESFIQLVSSAPKDLTKCRVVLITADPPLSKAVESCTSSDGRVQVVADLQVLRGFINAIRSQVGEELIASLKEDATSFFFQWVPKVEGTRGEGLYFDAKIYSLIWSKFNKKLKEMPGDAASHRIPSFYIKGSAEFKKKEGVRLFWTSRVIYQAEAFKRSHEISYPPTNAMWAYTSSSGAEYGVVYSPKQNAMLARDKPVATQGAGKVPEHPVAGVFPAATEKLYLFKEGEIIFEVTWSAEYSEEKRLISPKIDSIDYIETVWEPCPVPIPFTQSD